LLVDLFPTHLPVLGELADTDVLFSVRGEVHNPRTRGQNVKTPTALFVMRSVSACTDLRVLPIV
jgi:hypothetical protein